MKQLNTYSIRCKALVVVDVAGGRMLATLSSPEYWPPIGAMISYLIC